MHRNATRPYFTKERIAHVDNFEQHAEIALKLARQRLREGHPIDFQVSLYSHIGTQTT